MRPLNLLLVAFEEAIKTLIVVENSIMFVNCFTNTPNTSFVLHQLPCAGHFMASKLSNLFQEPFRNHACCSMTIKRWKTLCNRKRHINK